MYCTNCGVELAEGQKFCQACGQAFSPRPEAEAGLRKFNVPLLVFLCIITGGIYAPIWFLIKRRSLNALGTGKLLGIELPIISLIFLAISVSHPSYYQGPYDWLGEWRNWYSIVGYVLLFGPSLRVRRILDLHFNQKLGRGVSFNKWASFFLQCWYLQHKINRLV